MSLKKTKEQLIQLLDQADNRVIALSGKWGTGKTHLWNEVKNRSNDDKIKNALYVSLFGLSSVDQIKRKLIEMAIPGVESHGGIFNGIKNLFTTGVKAASAHYKALAAINDLNVLLMTPAVLKNKVVVIDDIERKHERLGIDEVLGFIDEYSNQYSVRFILVLNDDQLSSKGDQDELWETFREKVIDEEIRLSTSAEEAFSIAIGLVPSNYAETIKRALISCGVTNIRIVTKIIKTTNRILEGPILEEAIQARVVPSIVLFSAIHYRGIDDGPDFSFALSAGSSYWLGFERDTSKEPTDKDRHEDRWRLLMRELSINECDEFEQMLVEFLESGLFDLGKVKGIISRYIDEKEQMEAREAANKFLFRAIWDHRVDDDELVAEAALLVPIAASLDPYVVTEIDEALKMIKGAAPIGQEIIDGWITGFKRSGQANVNIDNLIKNKLHPNIVKAFAETEVQTLTSTTLTDVCMLIIQNQAWGTLQEIVMKSATVADFEEVIRNMEIANLSRYMRGMVEMRLNKAAYDARFGTATEHFMEACRTIANDVNSPRLANLIKRIFEGTSLKSELDN